MEWQKKHKAVGVERYHRFLNYAQRIGTEERGTAEAFVERAMTTAYAWNASCIDGTDIPRSIPAIGRELRFPLDIAFENTPPVIDNPSESVAAYLRYLGRDVPFARELSTWITEDRRERHRERVNEGRNLIRYKPGDIVMARVAVQSDSSKGKVAKLVYQSRGPFQVVRDTEHSSYLVQRYGKPKSPLQKFMTQDLYLLPPQNFPCESIDTSDLRYLNADFAPINHPLNDHFDFESYNTRWFDNRPASRPPDFILDSYVPAVSITKIKPVGQIKDSSHVDTNPMGIKKVEDCETSVCSLPGEVEGTTNVDMRKKCIAKKSPRENRPSVTQKDRDVESSPVQVVSEHGDDNSICLHRSIELSADKLFFIQYTPANTMRPRWFLIQVDLEESTEASSTGIYFCTFMAKHPDDAKLADNLVCWWPEWRELAWNEDGTFEFEGRILYGPKSRPNNRKYAKFSTDVNLSSCDVMLVGPFDYIEKQGVRKLSFIAEGIWHRLVDQCAERALLPPVVRSSAKPMQSLVTNIMQSNRVDSTAMHVFHSIKLIWLATKPPTKNSKSPSDHANKRRKVSH